MGLYTVRCPACGGVYEKSLDRDSYYKILDERASVDVLPESIHNIDEEGINGCIASLREQISDLQDQLLVLTDPLRRE